MVPKESGPESCLLRPVSNVVVVNSILKSIFKWDFWKVKCEIFWDQVKKNILKKIPVYYKDYIVRANKSLVLTYFQ